MHRDVGIHQTLKLLRIIVPLVPRNHQRPTPAQRREAAQRPERADGEEEGGAHGAVPEAVVVPVEDALEVQLVPVLRRGVVVGGDADVMFVVGGGGRSGGQKVFVHSQ